MNNKIIDIKDDFIEEAGKMKIDYKSVAQWTKEIRRDFHRHPELGTMEYRTAEKIEGYLKELGIEYKRVADTGVEGIIRGKKPGRSIAIRGDIDALPICEIEGREYGSQNEGVMHACGHDAHAAILLGTARVLNDMKDEFSGSIRLLFQPAEETIGGAQRMVAEGSMEGVEYVIGLHVTPYAETGRVELKYGKMNASSDTLKISVEGVSSHGAYPHMGYDAIVIAAQVVSALQTVVSRNISPHENAVLSFGAIKGGTQGNILADRVDLVGTLRTINERVREEAKKRIVSIVEGISASLGGRGVVEIESGYMSLINTDSVVDIIKESALEIVGEENIEYRELPSLGVEDFSFFIDAAKEGGGYFYLGCGSKTKGITAPAHNREFDIDEDCLEIGIKLQVSNTLKLLK